MPESESAFESTLGTNGDNKIRSHAFYAGLLGGIAGILLDIDHPIAYWLGCNWEGAGRFLHFPVAVACVGLLILAGTHLGRLHRDVVLGREKWKKKQEK
jgi:hypothetical protein